MNDGAKMVQINAVRFVLCLVLAGVQKRVILGVCAEYESARDDGTRVEAKGARIV
jgi:hypothetical protein